MRQLSPRHQSHSCICGKTLALFAAAFLLATAATMQAQTNTQSATPPATSPQALPSLPDSTPQLNPSGSSLQPTDAPAADSSTGHGAHAHTNGTGAAPFNIPHSISKTTSSGIKFQLGLPRVAVGTGQRGGLASPLDSSSTRTMGSAGSSMFPSTGSPSLFPSSDGGVGPSTGGFGGGTGSAFGGSHAGSGMGGNSAGGLTISAPGKSSMFDVHLSMKDLMGGSFSQGSGGGGGAGASAGAGSSAGLFGSTDTGAGSNDFGGGHGAGGGKGSGARVSMGLRF